MYLGNVRSPLRGCTRSIRDSAVVGICRSWKACTAKMVKHVWGLWVMPGTPLAAASASRAHGGDGKAKLCKVFAP